MAVVVGKLFEVVPGRSESLGSMSATGAVWTPLVATGVTALALRPLRCRLEQAVSPAALSQAAQTVSDMFQLPYAAIELTDEDSPRQAASPGVEPEAFIMTYQGQVVGRLLVAPRAPSQPFTTAERGLLRDLARQAGLAAHTARLTADLARAREEEHHRLRRDLHDGLGPALAGMTMQVGAARARLAADGGQIDEVFGQLEQQLQTCVSEVRRLVDDRRPPALDQLGLIDAIRHGLRAFTAAGGGSAPTISVNAPDDLGELPAAVEVAAYRIATEAVTNTVRHAAASRCDVRLTLNGGLAVEVTDNGVGLPEDYQAGVGLASMRERAEELGGALLAQLLPEGGTRIRAKLPLVHQ